MSVFFALLGLLFLFDALRLRKRTKALAVLAASETPADEERWVFLLAPGVTLDEGTRRAAVAHAERSGLEALDLIPQDLPATDLLGLVALVDFAAFRGDRLAQGRTAHHALLATRELCERAHVRHDAPLSPADFAEAATRLKRHASITTDFAIASTLSASKDDRRGRLARYRAALGGGAHAVLAFQLVLLGVLLSAPYYASWGGLAALVCFHLQPFVLLAPLPAEPRGLFFLVLFRAPFELVRVLDLAWGPLPALPAIGQALALRPVYGELALGDPSRFFEPRRSDCPLCGKSDLTLRLETKDLFQHKPGRFRVDRCRACGHLFQNPRLSLEGLGFYYRDFYDGLGEESLELVFGYSKEAYVARAQLPKGHVRPKAWLDVGGGHGHFAAIARDEWPGVRFDGLDFGDSIEEAERRRWVDKGFRGLFPEVAPTFPGAYDVVSMSHYLEHTRDPRSELGAAHTALGEGGVLLIEIPDPTSRLGDVFGRLWVPWFQPQHQHLLSPTNLSRLLDEASFDVLVMQRGEVHIGVDFFFAVSLILDQLAPPLHLPWLPPPTVLRRLTRAVVWTLGTPLLILARLLDVLSGPLLRKAGWSNAFRVLAKKR